MASAASQPQNQLVQYRPVWQICVLAVSAVLVRGYYRWDIIHSPLYAFQQGAKFLAGVLLLTALAQRWRRAPEAAMLLLSDPPPQLPPVSRSRYWWPVAGLAAMIAALVFLEVRQPYYFTQDDNLSQFLPTILQACRSGLQGVFPSWNPYQFFGSPTTSVGTYALTYPPTWFSHWFASRVMGNEYATMEVFVLLHLLAAYAIIYWVVRREGCRASLATLAALCCVLSGYSLLVGRSWYYIIPVFVWLPLLIACLQELRKKTVGWLWILAYGFIIGLFAHAGNVQLWAYSLLLLTFAVLVMLGSGLIRARTFAALIAGGLLGLAIAAPLLVPQVLATQDAVRGRIDSSISEGLPTLFIPVTVIQTWHPEGHGTFYKQYLGQMYYSGTLFCLLGTALLLSLVFLRWKRPVIAQNIWFLCALVSFVFALGNEGVLWPLLQHLPGFDKFRIPYKFLELFDIFVAIAGAVALERVLRRWRAGLSSEIAIVLTVFALLGYHCWLALPSFCTFGFQPYPQLDAGLRQYLQPHDDRNYPKVYPLGPWRSTNADYMQSLQLQWPSLFGIFSLDGYDLLVSEDKSFIKRRERLFQHQADQAAWLREYGIAYALTYDTEWPKYLKVSATPVYHSGRLTLWALPPARPMAWSDAEPSRSLSVRFDGAGADLDTSELDEDTWVTLNMIHRPEIHASAGNHELTVMADSWNRIRIQVPRNDKRVRVSFRPPWRTGFAVGGLFMIAALLTGGLHQVLIRRSPDVGRGRLRELPEGTAT